MSRSMLKYCCILILFLSVTLPQPHFSPLYAESSDQITQLLITPNRSESPRKKVASSVTVITAQEMEEKKQHTVIEALEEVPGLDIVRNGSEGGSTVIFMRGANSEHTLVLIDGIEANDPISPTRAFNFANLTTDNIERIEVLRGAQSTLYGSDAIGGVINIITKRGAGAPRATASFEGGSYSSFREMAGLSGGTNTYDYSLAVSRYDTHGISQAGAKYGNKEHDPYDNSAFSARIGARPSEEVKANFFMRGNIARASIDNAGGIGGDDQDRKFNTDQFFTRGEILTSFLDDTLKQTFGISYSDQSYDDKSDPDLAHPLDLLRSSFDSNLLKLDFQNIYTINETITLLAGIDSEREEGESKILSTSSFGDFRSEFPEQSSRTTGVYAQAEITWIENLTSSFGVRAEHHDEAGTKTTWRVAPTYYVESSGTKFSGTVGTGVKTPSLFELFSAFGNEELRPERSLGIDAGVEQELLEKRASIGITYFRNNFRDLITFEPNTFIFENIAEARSQGLEFVTSLRLHEKVSGRLTYTLSDTEDEDTGLELLRRPRNKASATLTVRPLSNTTLNINSVFVGKRADNDFSTFPATRLDLGGYSLFNIALSYKATDHIELYTTVENLFDKEYEEVLGFGTLGMAGYGGVRVSL